MSLKNPVRTLSPEVARKIAAGEVIDRPNSIVRELMDNSIDSGASFITVEISSGGIEKIRVVDDGCGMTKDDLQNCAHPHATSKIEKETDLLKLSTLGFRGEALASIAAVARLSVLSGGYKMRASITEDHILEQIAETKGTIVQSEGLFENFPARRQFLKRPATEGIMCKNTFIEKAMARPDIGFRFVSDGDTKLDLPSNQSLKERFILANGYSENPSLFYTLSNKDSGKNPNWSFEIVIGEPAVARSNKKEIFIYVNGRKIQEYALVQAVEYGGQGFFPNGTYPVAAVFITMNPEFVDFNIHPAKKEVRFADISEIHHALSTTIKGFFQSYTKANFIEDKPTDEMRELDFNSLQTIPQINQISQYEKHISYKNSETGNQNLSDFRSKYLGIKSQSDSRTFSSTSYSKSSSEEKKYLELSSSYSGRNSYSDKNSFSLSTENLAEQALFSASVPENENSADNGFSTTSSNPFKIKFLGSTLGTFLLAEKSNSLYIIDQHAAHERILFDKIMNSQGNRQPLLIPYKIKTESKSQDNQLEKLKDRLSDIGFDTNKIQDGYWEISSIPERWNGTEYDLRTLIFVKQVEPEQIIRAIAAMTACHAAVKDGYILDDETASKLVEQAFQLEDPHCPHGRPIYTVISRQKLFELVKRT